VPIESSEFGSRAYETYLWLRQHRSNSFICRKRMASVLQSARQRSGIGVCQYPILPERARTPFLAAQASQQFITSPFELDLDFMEQECFRRADALVTSTQSMRQWLEEQKWRCPTTLVRPQSDFSPARKIPGAPHS